MATAMRSDFMGAAVQSGTAAPKPTTQKFQVSVIFKKAQKQAKQVQESAKQKLPGNATQVVKKGQKAVKKAAPAPPSKKQTQAPKKAAQKVFQGAKKAGNKASKQAGASSSKGWFGEERASGLDKWYGTYTSCRLVRSQLDVDLD